MKTLVNLASLSSDVPRFAGLSSQKLIAEWQSGLETLSGCAQRKLRLSFAPLSANLNTNNSHEHAIHSGNGNGRLPLWWIRR